MATASHAAHAEAEPLRCRAVADVLIFADTLRSTELAPRGPARARRSVPLRRARRRAARRRHRVRASAVRGRRDRRSRCTRRRSSAATSWSRAGCRPARRSASCCALLQGARASRARSCRRVPARARRPPARGRDRGHGRPRVLRRAPPREERRTSSPASAAPSAPPRPAWRLARELLRARRAVDGALLLDGEPLTCERIKAEVEPAFMAHGAPPTRSSSRTARRPRSATTMGAGPILAGRADRLRPLPARPRDRLLRGHDAHVRRRRAVGRGCASGTGSSRGARQRSLEAIRPGADGKEVHRVACELFQEHGLPDAADEEAGRGARSTASTTGSATASGSRSTRSRASAATAPSSSPATWSPSSPASTGRASAAAARGPRARHRGRRREPDGLPVRPAAADDARRSGQTIETLFLEERRYEPPRAFAAQANAQPEIYERGLRGVLGARGARARDLVRAVGARCSSGSRRTRSGSSAASSTSPTTASTATSRPGGRQGRLPLGGRARGRAARDHLRRPPAARCRGSRTR